MIEAPGRRTWVPGSFSTDEEAKAAAIDAARQALPAEWLPALAVGPGAERHGVKAPGRLGVEKDVIAEHVENWSYLKFPYYRKMSFPEGVYRVGPLGRCNASDLIETPLANEELKQFKALGNGKPVEHTLYYHYARLIETLFAIERVGVLLDDPDILSTDILNTKKEFKGRGVGVLEAPRGTLFHDYTADEDGKLLKVNLIVSTGHNNWAMTEAVDSVAKTYIKPGQPVQEGMLNRVEAAVRAHDPCLSCSTHAIGQMPMIVDVVDSDGNVMQTLRRD